MQKSHRQQLVTIPTDPAARSPQSGPGCTVADLRMRYNAVRALRATRGRRPLPQSEDATAAAPDAALSKSPQNRPPDPVPGGRAVVPPNRSASWLHSSEMPAPDYLRTGTIRLLPGCPRRLFSGAGLRRHECLTPSWGLAVRSAPSWADPGISAHGNASFHSSFCPSVLSCVCAHNTDSC